MHRRARLRGSSPHAWGPPARDAERQHRRGIIPTRVGTTRASSSSLSTKRDHPHTRGDHRTWRPCDRATTGSSPHAWGPRRDGRLGQRARRIIPTRVGTTMCRGWTGRCQRDHPHTRGDHLGAVRLWAAFLGSSPHAWGPQRVVGRKRPADGIIPTRVGTTGGGPTRAARPRDHPHTRGDHSSPPAI